MHSKFIALSILFVAFHAADAKPAADPDDPLAPLRFLVGHCWQGTFPDGQHRDTHCYEPFYGMAFIRDRHLVRGPRPDYRGETVYQWDAESRQITYRYWNSLGGVSDGRAAPEKTRILFPGERHVQEDGSVLEIQSVMVPNGDSYRMITEQKTPDGWQPVMTIEFSRVGPATQAGPDQYEDRASD